MAVGPFPASREEVASALRWRSRDSARLAHYRELLDMWSGRHFRRLRRGRTEVVVNYCRAICDKAVEYLFGRGVAFAVPTDGPSPPTEAAARRAEQLLLEVAEDNALNAVLLQAATNASVLGDAFLKVYYDAAARRIRILNLDPARVFPTWAGDDPRDVRQIAAVSTLTTDEAAERYGRRAPAPPARGAPSTGGLVEIVELWTTQRLAIAVGGATVQEGPNPYGFIPFLHVPNLQPPNTAWGLSDLEDVIPLNREIDRRLSDQSDVIAYHADPPVVFKGVRQHTDLPVGPGTVWDIPADADVQLLEWHGAAPQVDSHLARLQEALFQVAETPRTSFGDSGRLLSGVALETELQPLILRTLRKRTIWDPALRQLARYVFMLAEQSGRDGARPGQYAPYRTRLIWNPILPRDDDAEAVRNINLVAARLRSHERAMELLGELDPAAQLVRVRTNRAQLGMESEPERAVPHIRLPRDR